MKHKAALTISRPTYGSGERKISIQVKDRDAGIRFLDIEIDYDSFTEAITGMGDVDCSMKVRGLENVGLKLETMPLEIEVPNRWHSDRKEIASKIANEIAPGGWSPSTYFGSQDSFFERDGKDYARTSMSRWVEKESE